MILVEIYCGNSIILKNSTRLTFCLSGRIYFGCNILNLNIFVILTNHHYHRRPHHCIYFDNY